MLIVCAEVRPLVVSTGTAIIVTNPGSTTTWIRLKYRCDKVTEYDQIFYHKLNLCGTGNTFSISSRILPHFKEIIYYYCYYYYYYYYCLIS